MRPTGMRTFWDERAEEDALFFVDNRRAYRDPEVERFFADGERDLDRFLGVLDVTLEPGQTVVEIGCGVGRLTRVIAARTDHVVALDVSERMLARARELNSSLGNVDWRLVDGISLGPVEDDSADVCLSLVVFQHIPDPQVTLGYIREVGRILRPGGWAAVQVSNDPTVHRRRGGLGSRLRALAGRAPRGQGHPAWLGSAVELEEMRQAAGEGGLEVERIWGEGTQFCCVLLRRSAGGGGSLA